VILDFSHIEWPAYLIAVAAIELTPGPNMGWLATHALREGRRAGLLGVLGIALGLLIQLIAAASGLSAALASMPVIYELIRWAGVAFMLYLAWEALRIQTAATHETGLQQGFLRGFVSNVLNPKALVFYIAIAGQFAGGGTAPLWADMLALGGVHLVVSGLVHTGIVMLASRFETQFAKWQNHPPARWGVALVLAGTALWLAFATQR
jgi:threonine/homoserine/homoserine lactone efflux protein